MHEGDGGNFAVEAHHPEQEGIAAEVSYISLLTKSLVCALSILPLHMHKNRVCV